jgi:hypothetical protein
MEALLEHSPFRGGKIDRPPLRPVRCSSRVAADSETGNNSPFRPPPPPVQHLLLLGGGGGVRRISSTTKKNQAQTKHLYRRLLRSCLPKRRSSIALVLIMSTSVGTVVCLLLLILGRPRSTAVVSQLAPPLLANATTAKQQPKAPMQSDRRMSVGLEEILSTVDYSNPRTRGLLEVLRSAHQNDDDDDPVWPDYLTLHRGATLPDVDTTACIVTAYFRVKNKYTTAKYEDEWMGNLLSLKDCLVIFCEDALVPTMLQARRSKPTVVIAMQLDDLPLASYHYPSTSSSSSSAFSSQYGDTATAYWEHQLSIDPERRLHKSYQLFWIWLSKTWFVATAALLQQRLFFVELEDENDDKNKEEGVPATTTTIQTWMWADIGSFRNAQFANVRLIQHPESLLDNVHNNARSCGWPTTHPVPRTTRTGTTSSIRPRKYTIITAAVTGWPCRSKRGYSIISIL